MQSKGKVKQDSKLCFKIAVLTTTLNLQQIQMIH